MAIGAVVMHYWGMTGLRIDGSISYRVEWALATAAGTVISCLVALALVPWLAARSHRVMAAFPAAAAIAGLHYVDMAATVVTPAPRFTPPEPTAGGPLALWIAATMLVIAAIAVAAAFLDEKRTGRASDVAAGAEDQHIVVLPSASPVADDAIVVLAPERPDIHAKAPENRAQKRGRRQPERATEHVQARACAPFGRWRNKAACAQHALCGARLRGAGTWDGLP
jgi:hypothetical protein